MLLRGTALRVLCLLPLSVSAFSTLKALKSGVVVQPSSQSQKSSAFSRRHQKATNLVLSSDPRGLLLDDECAPKPTVGAAATAAPSTLSQDAVNTVVGNSAEIGEEIFLATLENTTPESVLSEDERFTVPAGRDDAAIDFSLPDDAARAAFSYSGAENGTTGVGFAQQQSIAENVEAVLAASEDAMIAAEARLPAEVNEELDSFAPVAAETNFQFQEKVFETDETMADLGTGTAAPEDLTESVEAVLAASEDAMIAAEATLPADLKDELHSFVPIGAEAPAVPTTIENTVEIVPAEQVVGEPAITKIEAPPVMKILKFAIPAIGVWLCSPMLSLIDTSAVGVLSGTVQQAALNPAVAVTDYAALLIAFLYTATTNLIATAEESDRTVPGKPKTTSALVGAMQLSTYVGLGLGASLFMFARPLLRAIIGNDAIDPAVFAAAMKYVRIRSLGMPAAAIIGSAQAGCLGAKDIKSPLYVLLAAAIVNFFGDMIFVGCKHPIIGGAAGAAWATVFSQYAALAIFIRWLVKKPKADSNGPKVVDVTKNIKDFMGRPLRHGRGRNKAQDLLLKSKDVDLDQATTQTVAKNMMKSKGLLGRLRSLKDGSDSRGDSKAKENTPSVRGMLEGRFRGVDLLKLPSKKIAKEFAPYVAPVTVTQIGRVSGYVAMSHVVSSSLGTISMAAQQVIVSFFYCLTPIADSLSLTAQSFIPGISERKPSKERADALRKTGKNFMKAGGVFGAVMAAAIGLLPIMSGFFTSDPAVMTLVNMVVPLLVGFFSVHGVLCASEGVLLGQKDLGFLGKMYGAYFFAVPFFMLRVKRAALSGLKGINLSSVWNVFLGYQIFRLLAWVARVEIIQKRTDRAAPSIEDSI